MKSCILLRASANDAFKQFRRKQSEVAKLYPIPPNKPLNAGKIKIKTEEEIRKILRDPEKGVDPWGRLEFFTKEDAKNEVETNVQETAKPVDRPLLVQVTKAHDYLKKKRAAFAKEKIKQMVDNGIATQEEIAQYKSGNYNSLNDAAIEAEVDCWLSLGEGSQPVIFPTEDEHQRIDRSKMTFIEQLTYDYNVPGYISFEEVTLQEGYQTPIVCLSHPNGEQAVITLHGGCILAWMSPSGKNYFYVDPKEQFDNYCSIMDSGISLAFPFYNAGILPDEGFLNKMLWNVVRTEIGIDGIPDQAPCITLHCEDTPETRKIWPHKFEIFYRITLGEIDDFPVTGPSARQEKEFDDLVEEHRSVKAALKEQKRILQEQKQPETSKRQTWGNMDIQTLDLSEPEPEEIPTQLRLQFTVRNTGDKPMEFMFACKNHMQLRSATKYGDFTRVLGLGGRCYLDYTIVPNRPLLRLWADDYLVLGDRVDGWNSIFTENKLNDVYFCPGYSEYFELIYRKGLPDVLLHHKGTKDAKFFEIGNEMAMLGRARVTVPARLEPGEEWEGEYVLRHHDEYWQEPIFGYEDGMPPPNEEEMEVVPTLSEEEEYDIIE